MVYYRKYRPQTIEELDLDAVRDRLTSILSAKEFLHAFLFTGPKGLGKTSAARIVAKAINCENPKGIEPCNKCDNCTSITNGSNLDVLEIDAASNRGIDEIRDLREKIKFAPSSLRKKVYIIDEVHMLTTDAFNALLKTLEEPPSHAVFILCTTEAEKVPPTIMSRTFHVQFQKPGRDEIVRSLARIVKGEKLVVEKEVLDEIYKMSEGSFRDASKILEELAISSKDAKITKETFSATFKTAGIDLEIRNFIGFLSKKDLKGAVKIIEDFSGKGTDFKVVTEKLAETLHSILMFRAGITTDGFDMQEFNTEELKDLLSRVNDSYRDIKFSVLPQIPLELVAVGWCLEENQNSKIKSQNLNQKEEVKIGIVQGSEEKKEEKTESSKTPQGAKETTVEENKTKSEEPPTKSNDDKHGELFRANSKPENFMAAFITSIKQDNHSIAGILRGCQLREINNGSVLFETKFKFHKDKLNEAKVGQILDRRASEILKEQVHVVVNLVQ